MPQGRHRGSLNIYFTQLDHVCFQYYPTSTLPHLPFSFMRVSFFLSWMALSEIALTPSSCLRGFFPPRPSEQAWRMFHGVAEGAPGVTIDKYGSTLFVQSWRAPIVRLLGAYATSMIGGIKRLFFFSITLDPIQYIFHAEQ